MKKNHKNTHEKFIHVCLKQGVPIVLSPPPLRSYRKWYFFFLCQMKAHTLLVITENVPISGIPILIFLYILPNSFIPNVTFLFFAQECK